MKIRKGFVSNSSSSSFTCDICNYTASGMDMSLSECDMYECENGHTFCEGHTDKSWSEVLDEKYSTMEEKKEFCVEMAWSEDTKQQIRDIDDEDELEEWYDDMKSEYESESRHEVDPDYCPCCSLKHLPDREILRYFYYTLNLNEEKVLEDIRQKFVDYEAFQEVCSKK